MRDASVAEPVSRAIVIGFGNALRRDDGIGPYVAAQVESRHLPFVRTLAVHQLTPELAVDLSAAGLAVFVDARVGSGGEVVEIHQITPGAAQSAVSHTCDPRALVDLTLWLYGEAAESWSVTIAGEDFGVGEGLSQAGQRHADLAVDRIVSMLIRYYRRFETDSVRAPT